MFGAAEPVGYVLTKVSASGRRYWFTGVLEAVDVAGGPSRLIGKSGLLAGDAHVFAFEGLPSSLARFLNSWGIGGASWQVEPLIADVPEGAA